jgi:hypothetical protein
MPRAIRLVAVNSPRNLVAAPASCQFDFGAAAAAVLDEHCSRAKLSS